MLSTGSFPSRVRGLAPGLVGAFVVLAFLPSSAPAQSGGPTSPQARLASYRNHVDLARTSRFKNLAWQFLGPTNVSGRVTDVAVVEPKGQSYTIYAAAASGGVWKTINEGVTWKPVFEHGPSTSIGDVTVAPSDPDIVWVGTGEANIFRSSMAGAGVFRSTDAGATWEPMGLAGTHTIPRIVIHPTDPDIVYVAASGHEWTDNEERGVYRTSDGGTTWDRVLYVDERTGAIDLVMDPSDPSTLYAATWQRVRHKWNDPRNEAGYSGSSIYRTSDAGETWTEIVRGLPTPEHRGRIGIDVARSNPSVIYAFIDSYEVAREADEGSTDAYGRPAGPVIKGATVFRSDDRGEHWRQASEESPYMERLSATYGWVFGQIRVDPNDEDRVYVMGLALNVSDDGGRTFRRLSGMHGDHHGLWIDPANSNYLVNTNDGGLDISYDRGETWRNFNTDFPLVQFFNVAYDMDEPFHVFGSVQDHGSFRGVVDLSRGRHQIAATEWEGAPGGEGSSHAVDPTDPNTVYSAGFYGTLSRTDLATSESKRLVPRPAEGEPPFRGQWVAPFIISPHNPRILYLGLNYLFRSWDRGDGWERISPDLTYADPARLGDIPYQTIFSISESPLKFGLLYAGTDDGRVHVTRDGGASWTEITAGLVPGRFISEIVASRYDEGTVYLTQNGKRDDDFAPYVWKSTDYGQSWRSLAQGVPSGPVNVLREDPENPALLYLGTDLGVYASLDGGESWEALTGRIPTTFVHDLVVHPRDRILVAATHGRGMYALDVSFLEQLTPRVAERALHLFDIEPVRLGGGGGFGRTAYIAYWLAEPGPVFAVVKDESGQTIRELEASGDAGFNAVLWDLRRESEAGAQSGAGGGFGGRGAPSVPPGTYTVVLTRGSTTVEGALEVRR